ncbi:UNVERIFIED_CONTAM: AcrR family transcriptional regulator [Brevibacillus sp. OAP136]
MPKIIATEEEWVRLGVAYFSTGGEEALVIEKMAKQLACSKSSFYWYFKNRESFIGKIIGYWQRQATELVIESVESNANAEQKIRALLVSMFADRSGNDFMFYIRRLGQREAAYGRVLQAIEQKRMDYMAALLQAKGYCERTSREKAELIYHCYLGWLERNKYTEVTELETMQQVELIYAQLLNEERG